MPEHNRNLHDGGARAKAHEVRCARLMVASVILALMGVAGLVATSTLRGDGHVLIDWPPARWIVYPAAGSMAMRPAASLDATFSRRFDVPSIRDGVVLKLAAFRDCQVWINGRAVPLPDDFAQSRAYRKVDVASFVRAGENEIRVIVSNDRGPPAVWAAVETSTGAATVTDTAWESSLAGARRLPARLASSPLEYAGVDPFEISEGVVPSIARVWPMWMLWMALAGAGAYLIARVLGTPNGKLAGADTSPRIVVAFLCCVFGLWIAMVVNNSPHLSPGSGFDASGHLEYIEFIRTRGTLPLADDGWQMYHPPLYYGLAAILLRVVGGTAASSDGILVIRLFNVVLVGIMTMAIFGCVRLIYPREYRQSLIAVTIAAFLPMHLYLFQYPTNETLVGAMTAIATYLVLRLLGSSAAGIRDYALAGAALGVALLSKVTAIVLIPAVAIGVGGQLLCAEGPRKWRRHLARGVVLAATMSAVCGWHYLRVWAHFGTPLISNADSRVTAPWWQDPGYISPAFFLRFGESLTSPLYSFRNGFWDGYYSILWCDGQCGGAVGLEWRPPWAYPYMVAGAGLAIWLVVAWGVGWVVLLRDFIRRPSARWAFLIMIPAVTAAFVLWFGLTVPHFSSVKSFYGMPATAANCVVAAIGVDWLSRRSRSSALLTCALLATWAANSVSGFWISPSSTAVERQRIILSHKPAEDAIPWLERILQAAPHDWQTRVHLCDRYIEAGRISEARQALSLPPGQRDLAVRHVRLGVLAYDENRPDEALRELQTAIDMDPLNREAAFARVKLLAARQDWKAATEAGQDALRIAPSSSDLHALMGKAYEKIGEKQMADLHRMYEGRLKPTRHP